MGGVRCCLHFYFCINPSAPHIMFIYYEYNAFSAPMGQIYEENKDEDGFLYIAYSGENTFGEVEETELI